MNILVVGNVLKDVYLNLDGRANKFEIDENEIKWLNVSFNASSNRYFSRNSSLGGSAISLEVFAKLGLEASISGSDLKIADGEVIKTKDGASSYRYILISDGSVSYLTPSNFKNTTFDPPTEAYDYLYIDRSANLDDKAIRKINAYLDLSSKTKLVLYLNSQNVFNLKSLFARADLIMVEENREVSAKTYAPELEKVDAKKLIYLSETRFSYLDIHENVSPNRIDISTHLSFYSVASATILSCFILGRSVEESLKLARANVENSKLDSTCSLAELETIVENSEPENDLGLIIANLILPGKEILDLDDVDEEYDLLEDQDLENLYNGIILSHENQNQLNLLFSRRIIPGVKVSQDFEKLKGSLEVCPKGLDNLSARLRDYFNLGFRFAKWQAFFEIRKSSNGKILTPTQHAIEENCRRVAEYTKKCQQAGLVPIIELKIDRNGYYSIEDSASILSSILDCLSNELKSREIDPNTCILKISKVTAGANYPDQPSDEVVSAETDKVIKDHAPDSLAEIIF